MSYKAPLEDFEFLLNEVLDFEKVLKTHYFQEVSDELISPILTEAGRLCENVLAPLQRVGDLNPATLDNGAVRTSPGFADGYKAIAQGGWISIAARKEYGGMGLPMTIASVVNDMMSSACLSLQLNPLMTQGQIEALENHASEEIKKLYLPKLISGEWCGTMNLTEPQAGSDVGALKTKAIKNANGTYAITGQKIYISWGDNDFSENTCHLVLARLPNSASGTKGISLFLVPKLLPDPQGKPGVANSLKLIGLEHKLGLHGSPTVTIQYEKATGWLVGEPHDGMRAMFTMMNNARLGVGCQGVGTAEAALQHAFKYARDRKQGKSLSSSKTGTICDHADVRRMLIRMKADIFAARSIAMANAIAIDMSTGTGEEKWKSRANFLTPITKVFGTEIGIKVSEMGLQVHGGMGFVEETGAAQFCRDVRVTAIYEGTNGIQAMDFVGRKLMDDGQTAKSIIKEMEDFAEKCKDSLPEMVESFLLAIENLGEATNWMLKQKELNERFAGAFPFTMGFARVLGAYFHLRAAYKSESNSFRRKLGGFYINNLLPEYSGFLKQAVNGSEDLYAITIDDLVA